MLLKKKVKVQSLASEELDGLVEKICVTAADSLRGWRRSNKAKRYFIDIVEVVEVPNWNKTSTELQEEHDLRLVLDVDLEDHSQIVGITPHDLFLPFTNRHRKMIGEAFLTGCVRLATEPLDLELAADLAIPEIEEWMETNKP